MTTLETAPDIHTADALVERLFGAVLATMDLHAVYLGDRLGYYRALAAGPLTSAELAARTGTAERYAREWLEQQAVTGILVTDPEADAGERRYTLPAAYVAPLTDELDLGHVAPFARATIGFVKQRRPPARGLPDRRRGELGAARCGRPRGSGRSQPTAVPRPAGPGVPAVDPGRRRRPARRRPGRRRGLWAGLVVDRHRAGLPRRDRRRLRRRRSVHRGRARATPARRASTTGCGSTPWTPPP